MRDRSSPPLTDLIKQQVILGPVSALVRWRTHSYVLRQSLGFFQNDFAGRIANTVMQAAPARARRRRQRDATSVWCGRALGRRVPLFFEADWRLLVPLAIWLAAYAVTLIYFVPKHQEASTASSEARSMLTGRIVDIYTNILTVKLFAHTEREDGYAREAIDEQMATYQDVAAPQHVDGAVLWTLNGFLLVGTTGLAIWLWSRGEIIDRRHQPSSPASSSASSTMSGWIMWTLAGIFENIGVVQEGMETIAARTRSSIRRTPSRST